MPQKESIRLAPFRKEVLNEVEVWGWGKTMRDFDIKTDSAMSRLMEEWTGNPDFSISPKINIPYGQDLGTLIVNAMLDSYTKLLKLLEEERKRVHFLEEQLKLHHTESVRKAEPLLEFLARTKGKL